MFTRGSHGGRCAQCGGATDVKAERGIRAVARVSRTQSRRTVLAVLALLSQQVAAPTTTSSDSKPTRLDSWQPQQHPHISITQPDSVISSGCAQGILTQQRQPLLRPAPPSPSSPLPIRDICAREHRCACLLPRTSLLVFLQPSQADRKAPRGCNASIPRCHRRRGAFRYQLWPGDRVHPRYNDTFTPAYCAYSLIASTYR